MLALSLPENFSQTICQNLNIDNKKTEMSAKKPFQKDILKKNTYWKDQFQIHFPHLIDKVTRKNLPKNWYAAFEKAYIDEYKFTIPHSGSLVELSASTLAKLFTAAKSGNTSEFKKLHFQITKGPFDIKPLFYSYDKHGYTCYDWLYQNGHKSLLDEIFNEILPELDTLLPDKEPFEELKFIKLKFAIACNQQSYLQEHIKNTSILPSNLLLVAAQLGSLNLVTLLLEKEFTNPEIVVPLAFIHAASYGHTDIVEFFHKKILNADNSQIKQKYASIFYEALQCAICNEHKKTLEKLLEIAKESPFDINYIPPESVFTHQNVDKKIFILSSAAKMEDSSYVKMILEAGSKTNLGDINHYSPLENAIYKGNCETLMVLVQKGAEFKEYDYARVKNWFTNFHHHEKAEIKEPKTLKSTDSHMRTLVELMLQKYEIKNEPENTETISSWIFGMFHIEKPEDKSVKCRVCDILVEILVGKRSSKDLDRLSGVEKKILGDKKHLLTHIYQNFSNNPLNKEAY